MKKIEKWFSLGSPRNANLFFSANILESEMVNLTNRINIDVFKDSIYDTYTYHHLTRIEHQSSVTDWWTYIKLYTLKSLQGVYHPHFEQRINDEYLTYISKTKYSLKYIHNSLLYQYNRIFLIKSKWLRDYKLYISTIEYIVYSPNGWGEADEHFLMSCTLLYWYI